MSLIEIPTYWKIHKLYKNCEQLFHENNLSPIYNLASKAIKLNENIKSKPDVDFYSWPILTANLFFFRAKSMEAYGDNEDSNQIFSDYYKAINILKNDREGLPSLINSCHSMIDLCLYGQGKFSEKIIERCTQSANIVISRTKNSECEFEFALSQVRLAGLNSRFFPLDEIKSKQAIFLYSDSIKIFNKLEKIQEEFLCKYHLSQIFLNPVLRYDPSYLEKSIYYSQEALKMQNIVEISKLESGSLARNIAEALTFRQYGDRAINWKNAEESFIYALEDFDEVDETMSASILNSFLKLIFESGSIKKYIGIIEDRIDKAFSITDVCYDSDTWYDLLKHKYSITKIKESRYHDENFSYVDELRRLLKIVKKQENPRLWVDIQFSIAGRIYQSESPSEIEECLAIYEEVQCSLDTKQWPHVYFDLMVRIGNCYSDLEDFSEAYQYFSKAMKDVDQFISNDFRGYAPGEYAFPANSYLMRTIPYTAACAGKIEFSLKMHDYIFSRKSASIYEDLYLIESQVNRGSLFKKYMEMKQGQRIVFSREEASKLSDISTIEARRNELDALKKKDDFITRHVFFRNLDIHLKEISSWVLIPIIGNKISRLVLIPPHSSIRDGYQSPDVEISYSGELKTLASKEGGILKGIHDLSNFDDTSLLSNELSLLSEHLWDNFIKWTLQIMNEESVSFDETSLCIIGEGAISMFPFCLAKDLKSKKHLLDIVNIHYAPSLYCLYTLQERLKKFDDKLDIGVVCGSDEGDLSAVNFEAELIGNYFNEDSFQKINSSEIDNIQNVMSKTNHWHFAAHGEFKWLNSGASCLKLGETELPVTYLTVLQAKSFLRLVVLSSCESGIHNFLDVSNEPEGFLVKFLEIGSAGAIGSLWEQSDYSMALLMDRFYYYYINEHKTPVIALRKAQLWLKNSTVMTITSYITERASKNIALEKNSVELHDLLSEYAQDFRPFSNPYFWAGLILMGQ